MGRRMAWITSMVMLAMQLAGCSGTKEQLSRRGIEVHSGKVLKIIRF